MSEATVKPLPQEVKKNGLFYKLVKKGTKAAMYSVHTEQDGPATNWETMKIKVTPAREVFGVPYPAFETFPGNEQFGLWAWCHASLERAEKRFDELESGEYDRMQEEEEQVEVAIED